MAARKVPKKMRGRVLSDQVRDIARRGEMLSYIAYITLGDAVDRRFLSARILELSERLITEKLRQRSAQHHRNTAGLNAT